MPKPCKLGLIFNIGMVPVARWPEPVWVLCRVLRRLTGLKAGHASLQQTSQVLASAF